MKGGERMQILDVGVLGFGFMGRMHTFGHRTIPLYYADPPVRTRLRWVCTSREQTAAAAQRAGGFERRTTDYREVIADEEVDLLHVCTPNHLHFPALEAAIREGKHIYCDKPVTAGLEEAAELERLLPDYAGLGQTVLQYRFLPATLRAKQLVEEGFVGPVTHFRAAYLHAGSVDPEKAVNWKSTAAAGGGVIRDLGAHVVDLLWWLIGPFDAVNCVSRIWSPRRPNKDEPGETMEIDAEEAASMTLRRPDGAFGTVDVSKIATGTEDELRFEIHGRYGALRFNLMQPNYLETYDESPPEGEYGGQRGWKRIATVQRYPGADFPGPKFAVGWTRAHVQCLYSFLECIAEGRPPRPSLSDGLHLQRVLEAVRRSADAQDWVELPQPGERSRPGG
ncbi:MAG: Gfo/Idh/MocA family protein [Planctomycetota bacterium]